MKYITRKGTVVDFRQPPDITMKGLSFVLTDPGSWTEEAMLKIIWTHAGYLCVEVKLRDVYKHPTEKWIAHNYDLKFQIGLGLIDGSQINRLMADIEDELVRTLKIDMRGRGHCLSDPRIVRKSDTPA